LSTALTSHFSDVVGFLQDTGSFGLGFAATLNNLGTQAPGGAIYIQQQQNAAQEKALNASVTKEDALLAAQKITLTAELTLANEELQAIPSQLNQVNEIYSAISGYSKVQQ
jgi:flagellar hook-associated protein 2